MKKAEEDSKQVGEQIERLEENDKRPDETRKQDTTAEEQTDREQQSEGEQDGKAKREVTPTTQGDSRGGMSDMQNIMNKLQRKGMGKGENPSTKEIGRSSPQRKADEPSEMDAEGPSEMTLMEQLGSSPKKRQKTILEYMETPQTERWWEQKP